MSLTLKPILGCNLGCVGCYETEIFKANGNKPEPYNLEAILARSLALPDINVTLHGGEITLMPLPDMVTLIDGLQAGGKKVSIQTNGTLLREKLRTVLRDNKVHAGVSINGPDELNDDRLAYPHTSPVDARLIEATRRTTARILANVESALREGVDVSIITVLAEGNAGTDERLGRLVTWASALTDLGVGSWRWNLKYGSPDTLSVERAIVVYDTLLKATYASPRRAWNPFREWTSNLATTSPLGPCWMVPCDPYHTDAVHAIFGDGSEGNCLRTAPDGAAYQRHPDRQFLRQMILKQLTPEEGGCKGCPYWAYCHGGCTAETASGDWRDKTQWCKVITTTYDTIDHTLSGIDPQWKRVAREPLA